MAIHSPVSFSLKWRGSKPASRVDDLASSVAEELLKIHKSYLKPIQALLNAKLLKGAAHITGGGMTGNIPRVLPKGCAVEVNPKAWLSQPIFDVLQKIGQIPADDYRRTFNLGVGMVLIVGPKRRKAVAAT